MRKRTVKKQQHCRNKRQDIKKKSLNLEERIQEKQKQKEKLEREISEKYQKYIDRYDLIGGLVLESEGESGKDYQRSK